MANDELWRKQVNLMENLQPVQDFQQLHEHQILPIGETGEGGLG